MIVVPNLTNIPTAPLAATGLAGGFLVARQSGNRSLGGAVLGALGVTNGLLWAKRDGAATTAALSAVYLGGFGGSHALAKKIGAWPSVGTVAAVSAVASYVLSDRKISRG